MVERFDTHSIVGVTGIQLRPIVRPGGPRAARAWQPGSLLADWRESCLLQVTDVVAYGNWCGWVLGAHTRDPSDKAAANKTD